MKKSKKYLVLVLCFSLFFSMVLTPNGASVKAKEHTEGETTGLSLLEEDIEVVELEQFEIELINEALKEHLENEESEISVAIAVPAGIGSFIATIKVIGIGTIVIYTGGIVIGKAVAKSGSKLYNSVKSYVSPYVIGFTIPKSLRKNGNTVDLGKFKDKHGNTPLNKNSGTFNNGKWSVEKDTAGHGGRKWKVKNNGKRKASLDGKGKIIAD